ncbi:hypothetical protein PHPI107946_07715 [Phocicoccus pinnipedialis]|uniref:Uncharacterized protein n=1 Tax=Phocicoccus pinnipedialis TaxID=110845 RepID=A0A6V7RPY2_9BACL|nr:hypothetical protein [Jeotgalicoccus pinnipedialis]CAD2079689.1 hypothetical protein JEOPIN946_01600 [Jeotgalicoccus pinnipedialis]
MSRKTYLFLLIVLFLNSIRYSGVLLEGNSSLYFIIFFIINLSAFIILLIFNNKIIQSSLDKKSI